MGKIYKKILKNGLQMTIILIPSSKLIQCNVVTKCGFFNETNKEIEYAHYFEHLGASFTSSKYPDAMKNIEDIEYNGISYNASTSNYLTNYYMYGSSKFWKLIIDMMVHSFIDFKFDDVMLEKERQAIINELTPKLHKEETLDYNIYNLVIGGARHSIIDRIKSVRNATSAKLLSFRKKYYSSKNTNIIIAGDIDYKKIYSFIKCTSNKKIDLSNKVKSINDTLFKKIPKKINYFKSEQKEIQLEIIFSLNMSHLDPRRYILPSICSCLESILFKKLRYSEESVIYGISCDTDLNPNKKISIFTISTSTEKVGKLDAILKIIFEEVCKIKNKLMSSRDYDKIKNKLNTQKMTELNDTSFSSLINYYFPYIIYNRKIETRANSIKNYESISKNDIKKLSRSIFKNENLYIIYKANKNYNKVISDFLKNKNKL